MLARRLAAGAATLARRTRVLRVELSLFRVEGLSGTPIGVDPPRVRDLQADDLPVGNTLVVRGHTEVPAVPWLSLRVRVEFATADDEPDLEAPVVALDSHQHVGAAVETDTDLATATEHRLPVDVRGARGASQTHTGRGGGPDAREHLSSVYTVRRCRVVVPHRMSRPTAERR